MLWVLLTIFAASMQAWRNAFQSQLGQTVSVAGVTLARFIWAPPIAVLYLLGIYLWNPQPLPDFSPLFWLYTCGAAFFQILATGLMVMLFKQNNYAVGAGLAKSEAIIAAVLGVVFFSTQLSSMGWLGVMLGGLAVFILSHAKGSKSFSLWTLLLGLGSGLAFALTSLWIREASLLLSLPFPHRAAWVLVWVLMLQASLLFFVLKWRDPASIKGLKQHSKMTLIISVTSCLGSIGWFSAMSLQSVAYVKTLGQIEVFFTMLISTFWLKQAVNKKHIGGLIFIAIAAILVMWA